MEAGTSYEFLNFKAGARSSSVSRNEVPHHRKSGPPLQEIRTSITGNQNPHHRKSRPPSQEIRTPITGSQDSHQRKSRPPSQEVRTSITGSQDPHHRKSGPPSQEVRTPITGSQNPHLPHLLAPLRRATCTVFMTAADFHFFLCEEAYFLKKHLGKSDSSLEAAKVI
jgi:hypothetical protein